MKVKEGKDVEDLQRLINDGKDALDRLQGLCKNFLFIITPLCFRHVFSVFYKWRIVDLQFQGHSTMTSMKKSIVAVTTWNTEKK